MGIDDRRLSRQCVPPNYIIWGTFTIATSIEYAKLRLLALALNLIYDVYHTSLHNINLHLIVMGTSAQLIYHLEFDISNVHVELAR